MTAIQLYTQISSLPSELQKKVAEYVAFLKYQSVKPPQKNTRVAGLAKGMIAMKENFDDPLEDFQAYR